MYKRNFVLPVAGVVLAIWIIIIVPTSYQISNDMGNQPHPEEVTKWLKAHPNFSGCVHTNLQTGISKQVSCTHPEAQMHGDPPR